MEFNWIFFSLFSAINCLIFMLACLIFQDVFNLVTLGYFFFYLSVFFGAICLLLIMLKGIYDMKKENQALKNRKAGR